MSDIKVVKLITGEELLSSITDQDGLDKWILEKPYVMVMGPEGTGIMPWVPYAETDRITIDKKHVMIILEPKEAVKQSYSKMVGKIILNENKIQLS